MQNSCIMMLYSYTRCMHKCLMEGFCFKMRAGISIMGANFVYKKPVLQTMLLEPGRSSKASWPCAHDKHCNLHAQSR